MKSAMTTQLVLALMALVAVPAAIAKEVKIQVKSFIRHMAGPGEPNNQPPSEVTKKALGFDGLGQTRTDAYLFLLATDKMFSEDPPDGTKSSGQFRLWSQLVANVTCNGNKVADASFSAVDTAFGKEGILDSVGEVARKLSSTSATDKAVFSYRVHGRPHDSSIVLFTAVRPRACTFIWHDVSGVLTCSNGQPVAKVTLKASAFPSHKVWVDGKQQVDVKQGPFESLWKCDPANPKLVQ